MPPPFTTSAPWLFSKPLHVLGERQHVLGQRERGWREVGRKEVRKVEEMRVWREGEEVRRSWREGCERKLPMRAELEVGNERCK